MLVSPMWMMMKKRHEGHAVWAFQAEMEQALLQAERQAEREQAEAENDTISQLQLQLGQLDTSTQKEKEKVGTGTETGQLRASACLSGFKSKKKNPFLNTVASYRFFFRFL